MNLLYSFKSLQWEKYLGHRQRLNSLTTMLSKTKRISIWHYCKQRGIYTGLMTKMGDIVKEKSRDPPVQGILAISWILRALWTAFTLALIYGLCYSYKLFSFYQSWEIESCVVYKMVYAIRSSFNKMKLEPQNLPVCKKELDIMLYLIYNKWFQIFMLLGSWFIWYFTMMLSRLDISLYTVGWVKTIVVKNSLQ